MYQYNLNQFKKNKVATDRLTKEINESEIIVQLNYINTDYITVDIYFESDLLIDDKSILDNIVANHSGEPLPPEPIIVRTEVLTEHLKYVETGDVTQGLFSAESVVIDIHSGQTEIIKDISWKFTVAIKSGTIGVNNNMIGDELEILVSPNTIVGALISTLNVGDTTISVSPTVIQNIKRGYYIGLFNVLGGIELGRVIEIGSNYVKIDKPSTEFANNGSYVTMTAKIIPYLYFSDLSTIEIGKDIPTGQRLPANTIIRIKYKNNNNSTKKVSFFVEYLY
jgi:hypothetical protein